MVHLQCYALAKRVSEDDTGVVWSLKNPNDPSNDSVLIRIPHYTGNETGYKDWQDIDALREKPELHQNSLVTFDSTVWGIEQSDSTMDEDEIISESKSRSCGIENMTWKDLWQNEYHLRTLWWHISHNVDPFKGDDYGLRSGFSAFPHSSYPISPYSECASPPNLEPPTYTVVMPGPVRDVRSNQS